MPMMPRPLTPCQSASLPPPDNAIGPEGFTANDNAFVFFSGPLVRSLCLLMTGFVLLCLASICGIAPARADFTLASQNTLHLGWGNSHVNNYIAIKGQYFYDHVITKHDVTLLQEVMKDAANWKAGVLPAMNQKYRLIISPNKKGPNSYKEHYAAIVDTSKMNVLCFVSFNTSDNNKHGWEFMRPPDLLLVESKKNHNNGPLTWLVNFHAIWGDSVTERLDEANAMSTLVQSLRSTPPRNNPYGCNNNDQRLNTAVQRVVVAGDWNLSAGAVAGKFSISNTSALPTGDTSLTPDGQYSESYDHFVWQSANPIVSNIGIHAPQNMPWFRGHVSDHLGISATVGD